MYGPLCRQLPSDPKGKAAPLVVLASAAHAKISKSDAPLRKRTQPWSVRGFTTQVRGDVAYLCDVPRILIRIPPFAGTWPRRRRQ